MIREAYNRAAVAATTPIEIQRPRVLAVLGKVRQKRAVFVSAPAGYGKSAALRQYLATQEIPSLLVDLSEPRVLDDSWFLQTLQQWLSTLGGSASPAATTPAAIEVLAALDRDLILAIDGYEEIGRAADRTSGLQDFLFECLQDSRLTRLHLIAAGRTRPSFAYMRRVLSGDIETVGAGDLAFTSVEVRDYLQRLRGSGLPVGYARRRWRETRGWPAGLILTESDASGRQRSNDDLFRYLHEEVLASLPDDVAGWLPEAACLASLSAELSEVVLGQANAAGLIRFVETNSLFVERSARGELRFQPLFRDFLQSLVTRTRRVSIQLSAATLLGQRGDVLGSATHYGMAEDWDSLLPLVEAHGRALVDKGRTAGLGRLLTSMAAHRALPWALQLLQAELHMRLGAMEEGASVLSAIDPAALSENERVQLQVLKVWQALFESRPHDVLQLAETGLSSHVASVRQQGQFLRGSAAAYRMLRQDRRAEERSREALRTFQAQHDGAEIGYQKMELGALMFDRCELEDAARWFREAADTFQKLERFDYLPAALNQLGHVLAEMDELEEAQEVLLRARNVVADWPDHPVVADILQNLAITYRAMRRPKLAEECFREYERVSRRLGYIAGEQSAIVGVAITYAEAGHPEDAMALLEPIRNHCATATVELRLLMADLTIAWVNHQDQDVLALCDRLLLGAPQSRMPRYIRTAALFRLGSLVRMGAPSAVIHAAASSLIKDAPQLEFQARIHRDVARVAAGGVRSHPDPIVRNNPAWRVAAERGATSPVVADEEAPRRRPLNLEVGTLQPALRVRIDGEIYRGGWHSALDLFLYLVHHPEGGTAVEIGAALWGGRVSDHALQQRFHTMVAALRRILGEESVVRDSTSRPSRYRLHSEIAINYDAGRFERIARAVLATEPDDAQLPLLREARQLRVRTYWPARALRSTWFAAVHDDVEGLFVQLLEREIRLRSDEESDELDEVKATHRQAIEGINQGRQQLRAV